MAVLLASVKRPPPCLQLQVHFSCDDQAKAGELGTFREYATGETARTYVCPECDKAKRQRTG
jgi:hypothetical protein